MASKVLAGIIMQVVLFAFALSVFASDGCACKDGLLLRVGLASWGSGLRSVVLNSVDGLKLFDASGSVLLEAGPDEPIQLSADGCAFVARVGLEVKSSPGPFVRAVPCAPDAPITIQSADNKRVRRYRGKIEVRLKPVGMRLINLVELEDYLLGVVPAEMPSSYPLEAIKAQAIAARTYALANLGKHRAEDYDVCDTSHCQTYGGAFVETPFAEEAVRTTECLVLTYDGKLASVMYSGDCGGATQDISEVRPNVRMPYLCTVREPAEVAHCTWELSIPLPELKEKLVSGGLGQCAKMVSIGVSKISASGRVMEFEIVTDSGKVRVGAHKVRSALGPSVMKSLLLTVEQTQDGVVCFKGRGSGHGIGLCQVGAKWLASAPRSWSYERILAHYFPGTQVESLQGVRGGVVRVSGLLPRNSPTNTARQSRAAEEIRCSANSAARRGKGADSEGAVTFDVRAEAPNGL